MKKKMSDQNNSRIRANIHQPEEPDYYIPQMFVMVSTVPRRRRAHPFTQPVFNTYNDVT